MQTKRKLFFVCYCMTVYQPINLDQCYVQNKNGTRECLTANTTFTKSLCMLEGIHTGRTKMLPYLPSISSINTYQYFSIVSPSVKLSLCSTSL